MCDRTGVQEHACNDVAAFLEKVRPPTALFEGGISSTVLFRGTGRAAALAYPKNANVVAALAIAGAGFDDMSVTLVADPQAKHNTHAYTVTSLSCSYQIQVENAPTQGNARTSMTTVISILKDVTHHARTHKD